jgi:WXG100 family type VII secretion target
MPTLPTQGSTDVTSIKIGTTMRSHDPTDTAQPLSATPNKAVTRRNRPGTVGRVIDTVADLVGQQPAYQWTGGSALPPGRECHMPNVNVTYDEMRNAGKQLQAGQNDIESRLSQLKSQVDQLVAGGYVTDVSSKQFQTSYEEFNQGARQTIQGLEGMNQYLHAAADAFEQTDQQLSQQLNR